jgi:hypothetical protein
MHRLIVSFAVVSLAACSTAPSSTAQTSEALPYCNPDTIDDTDPPDCGPCRTARFQYCHWSCVHTNASCGAGEICNEEYGKCTCAQGRADCDGDPSNGCEVSVSSDVNNCGECGNICPGAPNDAPICSAGQCAMSCETGYADCDGDPTNGCEDFVATDPNNCGECGNVCAAGSSCTAGKCVPSCPPGYMDCDGNPTNGCETLIGTTDNCAACGNNCNHVYKQGGYCENFLCQPNCTNPNPLTGKCGILE